MTPGPLGCASAATSALAPTHLEVLRAVAKPPLPRKPCARAALLAVARPRGHLQSNVAVLVGPAGEQRRTVRAAITDDARYGLVEYLAGVELELVLTEAFARTDLIAAQAVRRGLLVWTVDDGLVAALLAAAAIREPARAAALLGRLPSIPLLRASLRRLTQPAATLQLPLL